MCTQWYYCRADKIPPDGPFQLHITLNNFLKTSKNIGAHNCPLTISGLRKELPCSGTTFTGLVTATCTCCMLAVPSWQV
jgi:hypothetical protein